MATIDRDRQASSTGRYLPWTEVDRPAQDPSGIPSYYRMVPARSGLVHVLRWDPPAHAGHHLGRVRQSHSTGIQQGELGSYMMGIGNSMAYDRDLLRFTERHEWRGWLEANYSICSEAWLVIHKKHVADRGLTLNDAIEEALCFGWIDGTLKPINDETYSLRFTPRKKNSVWALSNVRRVERLTASGLMMEAGMAAVREAIENGQWEQAHKREQLQEIPEDLQNALRRRKGALQGYRELTASRKKQLLYWLDSARRPETRKKRVAAIVDEAVG